MNNDLRAIKGVVVDAGHGGDDPGAVNGNVKEKDFTLAVAEYIYNRLKELGIPTYITRSTDETLNRDERVSRILNAFGNSSDVIVLSNHINAGGGEGAEVVYALRNSDALAKGILEAIGSEGQQMRKYYQRRLPSDPSKDYYFIQRLTGKTQPVLIEYGFIDNKKDLEKLENNLLTYGEAVVRAVAEYTNTPYVSPDNVNSNIYVVQRGDTLYSIANKFNITVSELKAANNLTSNLLNIGEKLVIPGVKEPPKPSEYVVYTVKQGDNLYNIAKEFDTTVDAIVKYNQLSTTNLSINQELLIPIGNNSNQGNNNTEYYTVQRGDSLYKIANKFNVSVDDIIKANNLTTTLLQIGDQLIIPNSSQNSGNDSENNSNNENGNITYIVKSGDSLYSIAKRYNTTADELKRINNLTSNLLMIGQELIIPSTNNYVTYYVKSGDSLYTIARRYNTTVNEIKKLNNLTNELLSIGQVLLIPA